MTPHSSSNVLTSKDIHRAMKALEEQSAQPIDLVWIENEFYYMSRVCEDMWGKRYSLEEVDVAKKREDGLLDERRGYKLYITRMLKSSTPPINQHMNDHICSGRCRREGCPNCPHGKGDEEHCDVCDAVTKASETPCTHEARTYDSKGYWKCKCGMVGN